jgi:hypothetical protein
MPAHHQDKDDFNELSYGRFTSSFVDDLAQRFQGKQVLEIFAGNGLLASKLAAKGVSITATSLFAGHDWHHHGLYHGVIEMDAVQAVKTFGAASDVLLVSWPTVTDAVALAVLAWDLERDIFFIGEMTDYSKHHLGGCATDIFFEIIDVSEEISSYTPRNIMENAVVMRLKPNAMKLFQADIEKNINSFRQKI